MINHQVVKVVMPGYVLRKRLSTWRSSIWFDNNKMLQLSLKIQINLDRVAKGGSQVKEG
jgi:hypothetical protein